MKIEDLEILKSEITDKYYIANPKSPSNKKDVTESVEVILGKEKQKSQSVLVSIITEFVEGADEHYIVEVLHNAGMEKAEIENLNVLSDDIVEEYFESV